MARIRALLKAIHTHCGNLDTIVSRADYYSCPYENRLSVPNRYQIRL